MNKTTALLFFGIIVLGIVISLVTIKGCKKEAAPDEATAPAPVENVEPGKTEDKPGEAKGKSKTDETATSELSPAPEAKPAPPAPDPAPAEPESAVFASPEAAMKALAAKVVAKDYPGFLAIVGEESIPDGAKGRVRALVENPEIAPKEVKPFSEVSKSADGVRWALNLISVTEDAAEKQLYADLKEVAENSFSFTGISLPLEVGLARGSQPQEPATPAPSESSSAAPAAPDTPAAAAPPAAADRPDAITVAHAFSKAVIQRDFNTARSLSDPTAVTDERVAALMIAVEEGKFALKEDRPLVVTLSREDITWVLARVQSESASSEFALELGQIDDGWKVNGLTFSKVLSVLSEAAGGDVAYSPIVDNPAGGDSLVLYFEFDDAGLTSRTERQLSIVAEILNQGPERIIRINGHADALGSEDYNVGLSDRRAESIRKALISRGVKPDQVVTEAFGAAKPRKPNFLPDGSDNPSGRSENRRAEVFLDF